MIPITDELGIAFERRREFDATLNPVINEVDL
jgi:hypothetical protein